MNVEKLKAYVTELVAKSKSQNEIARKCGISTSALSQWLSGKYKATGNDMAIRIARELRFVSDRWNTVETVSSYRQVQANYLLAKSEHVWKGISSCAGIGKTESLFNLYLSSPDDSVVYVQCARWTARQLLLALRKATRGVVKNYETLEEMKEIIVSYAYEREDKNPVLLIDEADKLLPAAFAELNDIENRTKGYMGAVLAGTESLENIIHGGATKRIKARYMDESESRLGRDFVHLWGAMERDVYDVCAANGVDDPEIQERIWFKLKKVDKKVPMGKNGKEIIVPFTEDFRCMTQLIKEERFYKQMREGRV